MLDRPMAPVAAYTLPHDMAPVNRLRPRRHELRGAFDVAMPALTRLDGPAASDYARMTTRAVRIFGLDPGGRVVERRLVLRHSVTSNAPGLPRRSRGDGPVEMTGETRVRIHREMFLRVYARVATGAAQLRSARHFAQVLPVVESHRA